jgi:hypothetical protein
MLGLTDLLLRRVSAGLVDVIPDLLKDQMLAPVGALLDSVLAPLGSSPIGLPLHVLRFRQCAGSFHGDHCG